jgi:serine/threonine protein kinase
MLSTENPSDAVVKLVDFGCAQVTAEDSSFAVAAGSSGSGSAGKTPAYCPPEVLDEKRAKSTIEPSMDMWVRSVNACGALLLSAHQSLFLHIFIL